MQDPGRWLRNDLNQLQDLLKQSDLLTFREEEKRELLTGAAELLHKLDSLAGSVLTVGLIGGTGVGKSSIMNALAAAGIASTSHRRPHTDRVLIYRHQAIELPPAVSATQAPWHEITHDADAIRQVLLCDLPDFDSLVGEHREHVLEFLEHLDLLLWVVSPEKYADRRFYELLRSAPKARQNFTFIFNKVDLFFQGDSVGAGYEKLDRVTALFRNHILENGVGNPLIYTISAQQAYALAPAASWNQFPTLRQQIFQHRDVKEITAIKAANLDVEVQRLFALLQKEVVNLQALQRIMHEFIGEVEQEREQWVRVGREAFDRWLVRQAEEAIAEQLGNPSSLVGVGHGLAVMLQEWQRVLARKGSQESPAPLRLTADAGDSLRRQLERLENRIAHHVLRWGGSSAVIEQLQTVLNAEQEWGELADRLQQVLHDRLSQPEPPSSRMFRLVQVATYGLLTVFFLLALAGQSARAALLADPGWSAFAMLLFNAVHRLFTPSGLAALASYGLLQVFFGFRFYGRYKKLLQQRARRFIESLKLELGSVWEAQLDRIVSRLTACEEQFGAQAAAISALQEAKKGN